jgi:hypothetical protein
LRDWSQELLNEKLQLAFACGFCHCAWENLEPVQRFGVVVEEAILKSEGITGNDFGDSDVLRFCVES